MFYTVFDIETTGLNPRVDNIIQLAYVNVKEDLEIVESNNFYLYEDNMSWSEQAESVHKISKSWLFENKSDFFESIKEIYIKLNKSILVGHNMLSFDLPFLNQFLARYELPMVSPVLCFDTLKLFKPIFKKSMKLKELATQSGFTDELVSFMTERWFGVKAQTHDARWDVTATALLLIKARKTNVAQFI
ncbi:MAG: 3'-5' exonuclease [Endomicrobium sp.]|jgi:DNA polymerase III epsilon subunit-like protein|nr:3'-5' exonuclease [Endomicrobium sp.]